MKWPNLTLSMLSPQITIRTSLPGTLKTPSRQFPNIFQTPTRLSPKFRNVGLFPLLEAKCGFFLLLPSILLPWENKVNSYSNLFQPSWKGVFDNPRMEVSKADMVAQLDKAGVESDMKLIENEPKVKNNFICSLISQNGWRKYDFWAQDHFRVSSRPFPHWWCRVQVGCCSLPGWAPAGWAPAVRRVVMYGCTVPRRGEENFLPGSREKWVIYNKSTNG